jgi:hypothetical protein
MTRSLSYYRARIEVIQQLISTLDINRVEKGNDIILLRNGVFPGKFNEEKLVQEKLDVSGKSLWKRSRD